jgi:glycosyltransferase involved in cell wall biosynthesis
MNLPAEKISVVYNGVRFGQCPNERSDHPVSSIQYPVSGSQSAIVIGTVARLAPQKGVEYFVRAAALIHKRFPSASFAIIGDGPFRGELEALAGSLGIREQTKFLGFRSDAMSIASTFDVFVLPSTREAFGLTLVEALSQGVPVVASDTGGIPEIIDGKTTGLLANPGNPEDIAQKVCRLLDDRDLARSLACAGSAFVRANFSSDRMVEETQGIYEEVLRNS